MKLVQSGSTVKVVTSKKPRGSLIYRAGAMAGVVACKYGGRRALSGTATGRSLELMLTPAATAGPTAAPRSNASRRASSAPLNRPWWRSSSRS